MRRDELLRLLRAQPFRLFRLRLSNDAVYEIRHPDMAIVTPSAVYVGVPAPGSAASTADDIVVGSLLHVLTMEYLTPANPPAPN